MGLGLEKASNIAEIEGKAFIDAAGIVLETRRMVGHQKPVISDLAIDLQRLDEIDIAFIREGFDEIVAVAADIPEMDIEDLAPFAEPADHVTDFLARLLQHLRHGALAEIQPMIWAFT